ncbi:MAG: glycosyltransferase family 4 protein [Acidobacteriota bacterium]|nr:glycosyltransferase family 4 protein [Acidobacteriota bacterium]
MSADTIGGVWTFALGLTRALEAHGARVSLATMGHKLDAGQWREARRIPNLEIFESGFKLEWMDHPWDDVRRAGDWLLSLEAKIKPDAVHLNTLVHGALPWSAPALITGHSCVLSWWEAVKREQAPPEWERYRAEVKRSLDAAGLVTAPTRAMLDALREQYNFSGEAVVVSNGADLPCRAALKEPFILAAGRLWDEGKNIAALDRVAPLLSWPVYLAGEGGASKSATMLGRISSEELAGWYARASIYCLPARYEPFGLSILEAALSGCALVLGNIASLREVWGDAAIFVAPNDDEQLESALQSLIADEGWRKKMASRAVRRASRFTPKRMAAGYVEGYAAAHRLAAMSSLCAS